MLQIIRKWTIRTIKEYSDNVVLENSKWVLYKDEKLPVVEMDITELRDLKEFFDNWKDPFASDNPNHFDRLK